MAHTTTQSATHMVHDFIGADKSFGEVKHGEGVATLGTQRTWTKEPVHFSLNRCRRWHRSGGFGVNAVLCWAAKPMKVRAQHGRVLSPDFLFRTRDMNGHHVGCRVFLEQSCCTAPALQNCILEREALAFGGQCSSRMAKVHLRRPMPRLMHPTEAGWRRKVLGWTAS